MIPEKYRVQMRDGSYAGVLACCESLHMLHSGAAPDLRPEDAVRMYGFLKRTLAGWQPSSSFTLAYDNAVKALAGIVVTEHELVHATDEALRASPKAQP